MEKFIRFIGKSYPSVYQQIAALASQYGLTVIVWREDIQRVEADLTAITVMIDNDTDQIITRLIPPGE